MTEMNIDKATVSNMDSNVPNFEVPSMNTDAATGQKETEWMNTKAPKYHGYYKTVPELNKAIQALATWTVGKGFETEDTNTEVILDNIRGWGEDTINSIFWNLLVNKKVYGDCFAEIIRDEKDVLINLKVLDPAKMKIIVDEKGMIKRYEQMDKIGKDGKMVNKFTPNQIFHSCNDRFADEIHGNSVIDACEFVINFKNELMDDIKTVAHRNVVPVRIIEVDTDDQTKVDKILAKYELMIKRKEAIAVPKGAVQITTEILAGNFNPLPLINYLDNFFYRAVGVPKVIVGGSEEFTEASSKIGYLTFDQIYLREQREFEADFWNQVYLHIKFNKPASLQNELLDDQNKDKESGITKPNEMRPTMRQE